MEDDLHVHASLARNVSFPTPVAGEEDGVEPTYVRDRGCIYRQRTGLCPRLDLVRYMFASHVCVTLSPEF